MSEKPLVLLFCISFHKSFHQQRNAFSYMVDTQLLGNDSENESHLFDTYSIFIVIIIKLDQIISRNAAMHKNQ